MLLLLYRTRLIVCSNDQIFTFFVERQSLVRIREMMSFIDTAGAPLTTECFQKSQNLSVSNGFSLLQLKACSVNLEVS